jgi:hypothetical protein
MENPKICYTSLFLEVGARGDCTQGCRKEGFKIST